MSSLVPDIAMFIRTVELKSFAAVAEETGLTPSGVSRTVSRLENSVGVKLLYRSTRRLALTPEGETFLVHARRIVAATEAAEADVAKTSGRPRGNLHVNVGTAFARHRLAPALSKFLAMNPEITIDISVGDRRIDPITEQVDVTVRVGSLLSSDLIGVRLGTVRRIIAASPAYLSTYGIPTDPADLLNHNCLLLNGFPHQRKWPFLQNGGRKIEIEVRGNASSDSADTLLDMAVSGVGVVRLGDFLGAKALAAGHLVPLLEDCHENDPQPITALVPPGREYLPRVRAFIDFLKSEI